jgi:hypothetical protein
MLLGDRRGGNCVCVKSGLKQEKSSVRPFKLHSSFYTSRGGGSEAPIRRMARWGLLANCHGTSLKKFNFNPRVCFYDYFCMACTGRRT